MIFPKLIILFIRNLREQILFEWKLKKISIIFPSVVNTIIEKTWKENCILMNYVQQMRTVNCEWDLSNNKLTKNIPQKIACEILLSFSLYRESFNFFQSFLLCEITFFLLCSHGFNISDMKRHEGFFAIVLEKHLKRQSSWNLRKI